MKDILFGLKLGVIMWLAVLSALLPIMLVLEAIFTDQFLLYMTLFFIVMRLEWKKEF